MDSDQKFNIAFKSVIGEEGGYVNDPRDPGGETKFGIAKRFHPSIDIKNLTLDQARAIYREQYWDPAACDLLGTGAAVAYFDGIVNMGLKTAPMLMQASLGEVADSIIGPRTRAAMRQRADDPELVVQFMAERGVYYASRPHFDTFGRGWLRRVIRVAMEAARADNETSPTAGEIAA